MSKDIKQRQNSNAIVGIAVYSRDAKLVKSISAALKQYAVDGRSRDYVVLHQASLSISDNVCAVSIFDVDMVDSETNAVRDGIAKIKAKNSSHPLFLVGDKAALADLIQDSIINDAVSRTIAKTMLGPKISMALNMVLESSINVGQQESPNRKNLGLSLSALAAAIVIAVGVGYMKAHQGSDLLHANTKLTPADNDVGTTEVLEKTESDIYHDLDEKNEAGSALFADSVIVEKQETKTDADNFNQEPVDTQSSSLPTTSSDNDSGATIAIETQSQSPIFGVEAEALLEKARVALKKGFIVGPDDSCALHYYRQALNYDPYSDQAKQRQAILIAELKPELMLAIKQAKYGRSNSIFKVIKAIDPINPELESLQLALDQRFSQKG